LSAAAEIPTEVDPCPVAPRAGLCEKPLPLRKNQGVPLPGTLGPEFFPRAFLPPFTGDSAVSRVCGLDLRKSVNYGCLEDFRSCLVSFVPGGEELLLQPGTKAHGPGVGNRAGGGRVAAEVKEVIEKVEGIPLGVPVRASINPYEE